MTAVWVMAGVTVASLMTVWWLYRDARQRAMRGSLLDAVGQGIAFSGVSAALLVANLIGWGIIGWIV